MKNKGVRKAKSIDAVPIEDQFEHGDAEASETIPKQCSSLRKGGYVCMKDRPCKIMEMATSAPGKHGHAKIVNVGRDGYLTLMDDKGQLRSDLKNPDDELGENIKAKFEKDDDFMVCVVSAMGEEKVISLKCIKQP